MPLLPTKFVPRVYKKGDTSEFGFVVSRQLIWHDHYVVYLTEGRVAYEASDEVLARSHDLLREFNFLNGRIDAMLRGAAALRLREQLGIALCDGFDRAAEDLAPDPVVFKDTAEQISLEAATAAKTIYIVSSGVILLLLFGWLAIAQIFRLRLPPVLGLLSLAVAAGGIGAFLSLLIRLSKMQIVTNSTSRRTHVVAGVLRLGIGIAAAIVTVLAIRGDVFLGYLNGNTSGTLFACVAAGFVEKFVPEMLVKFTEK